MTTTTVNPRSCQMCKLTEGLKICVGCKNVWYCCKECQKADWKAHKPICQLLIKETDDSKIKNGSDMVERNDWAIPNNVISSTMLPVGDESAPPMLRTADHAEIIATMIKIKNAKKTKK